MTTVTITGSGQIRNKADRRIGEILAAGNTIKKIEIDPRFQNEGYGRAAIEQYCEDCYELGYSEVYVACVTNKYLIRILQDIGGMEVSSHKVPIAPHPMLEPDKPDYKVPLPLNS